MVSQTNYAHQEAGDGTGKEEHYDQPVPIYATTPYHIEPYETEHHYRTRPISLNNNKTSLKSTRSHPPIYLHLRLNHHHTLPSHTHFHLHHISPFTLIALPLSYPPLLATTPYPK